MQLRRTGVVCAATAAAVTAAMLSACSRPAPAPAPAAAPTPAPAEAAASSIKLAVPPPPLGRAELLAAVAAAADAYASGERGSRAVAAIAGRRFRLRLPFGCFGQPAADARFAYVWDEPAGVLKLSAAPEDWSDDRTLRTLLGDPSVEALEGFWLRRPWLRHGDCPAIPPTDAPSALPTPESVGLVSVFGAEDSRLRKRAKRPYEITRKPKPDELPSPNGYRLVLEGRIGGEDGHPAIACRSAGPNQRPVCFVRISLDRVAFETPSGEQLGEWAG